MSEGDKTKLPNLEELLEVTMEENASLSKRLKEETGWREYFERGYRAQAKRLKIYQETEESKDGKVHIYCNVCQMYHTLVIECVKAK